MPDRDKLLAAAAHFRTTVRGNRLLLVSEAEEHLLDGEIYVAIAAALSQNISWPDLRLKLTPRYPLAGIQDALTVLAQLGFAQPAAPAAVHPGLAAWLDSIPNPASQRSVEVQRVGAPETPLLDELLRLAGFTISPDAATAIVLTDDYLNPALRDIDRTANRPWLLAKLAGHTLWLGPFFKPGQSPCWECLAWWLRMHRWQQWGVSRGENSQPLRLSVAHWPATLAIGAGLLVTAVLNPGLQDCLLTFDTRTLHQSRHPVRPVPGCVHCRACPLPIPADLRVFVSFATGIVERLELSGQSAGGLFHAHARFVHALPAAPAHAIMRPGESFGKAATAEEAGVAATAEAIERYSFTWRGSELFVTARPAEIDGIPLNHLGQYSDRQFARRADQPYAEDSMFWVPYRLPEDTAIGWTECRALNGGPSRYAPSAAVYYAYPFETEYRYFVPDSNGCAAGRTYEDALASAFGELVERDALAIWWYNRLRRPALRLPEDELDDVTFNILVALREQSRAVTVLDVTTDIGVPAYVALAPKPDGSDVVFAAAAHLCPHRALQKTLAEVSQILYWKDRIVPHPELANWLRTAHLAAREFDWLLPDGEAALPPRRRVSPANAAAEYASRLSDCGISSYWIDLTRLETAVPVVRAIAPGLRHPWSRFAAGRLYEVPVKLGWLKNPTAETNLNPIACML